MEMPASCRCCCCTCRDKGPPLGSKRRQQSKSGRRTVLRPVAVAALCVVSFCLGSLWTAIMILPGEKGQESLLQQSKASFLNHGIKGKSIMQLPASVHKYAAGIAFVDKDNFTQTFDLGVPMDETVRGTEDVLLLYKHKDAMPDISSKHTSGSALHATENCDIMHVVLTEPPTNWSYQHTKQCMAIVPQFTSFHVQNWMRIDDTKREPVDSKLPLRFLGRGYRTDGVNFFFPPLEKLTKRHWKRLQTYWDSMDDILAKLQAKTTKVANQHNALIVMVCNLGQSDLLVNFVCSAEVRNFSLNHVLVFATDVETKQLSERLGLATFFDERIFGHTPSQAAKLYGDSYFSEIVMAKAYCVQMVSMLGHDILFQDVDVVWYREDILAYFQSMSDFDIYFQDDGQRSLHYAPYSANSGFYYVRHNQKTQRFLTSVLLSSDLILQTRSHQQALNAVLAEHASLYGLRVKVLHRHEFPCGYTFIFEQDWMRQFLKGKHNPCIFHFNWSSNKEDKVKYLKQMGEWNVQDKCDTGGPTDKSKFVTTCCSSEPLVSCHYRDIPSKVPCNDSPPKEEGAPSFW